MGLDIGLIVGKLNGGIVGFPLDGARERLPVSADGADVMLLVGLKVGATDFGLLVGLSVVTAVGVLEGCRLLIIKKE